MAFPNLRLRRRRTRRPPFRPPARHTQLPRILKRIWIAVGLLLAMITLGTAGFYWAGDERANLSDALYMTLITVTTVGYGEVVPLESLGERLLASAIAIGGFGIITFLFTSLAAFFLESDFDYTLRRRRMEKDIAKLSGHYIICGFGRVGRNVGRELAATGRRFVAIDADEAQLEPQREHFPGLLYLHGDASDDDLLQAANLEDAAGVFAVTGDDSRNLMIVFTVRQHAPRKRIVARAHELRNADKMRRAGANEVASPDFTGGMRIASAMIRPHVVSFLDEMLRSDHHVRLEEVRVPEHAVPLTAGTLRERCPDMVLLSVRAGGEIFFNPNRDHLLQPGQIIIAMVTPRGRHELEQALGG